MLIVGAVLVCPCQTTSVGVPSPLSPEAGTPKQLQSLAQAGGVKPGFDKSSTPESFCCNLQTYLGSKQEYQPATPAWTVPKARGQGSKGLWKIIFLRVANTFEPAKQEKVQN